MFHFLSNLTAWNWVGIYFGISILWTVFIFNRFLKWADNGGVGEAAAFALIGNVLFWFVAIPYALIKIAYGTGYMVERKRGMFGK